MPTLRKTLDEYTKGALTALNKAVNMEGLQGHITVLSGSQGTTFIFSGYKDGTTRYFQKVTVLQAEELGAQVMASEEIRSLKQVVGFSHKKPKTPIWN